MLHRLKDIDCIARIPLFVCVCLCVHKFLPEYSTLWSLYSESRPVTPTTRAQASAALQGFRPWVDSPDGVASRAAWLLREGEGAMPLDETLAHGLNMFVTKWDRAVVGGVSFTVERLVQDKKVKNSVVMVRVGDGDPFGVRFGVVRAFYKHSPPGIRGLQSGQHFIADVSWFKWHLPSAGVEGNMNKQIGAPFVSKSMTSRVDGNFWAVENLVATRVALATHHTLNTCWQVLHRDSNFLTKPYP